MTNAHAPEAEELDQAEAVPAERDPVHEAVQLLLEAKDPESQALGLVLAHLVVEVETLADIITPLVQAGSDLVENLAPALSQFSATGIGSVLGALSPR